MTQWRPLTRGSSPEADPLYDTLHEGLPAWMFNSVRAWFLDVVGFQRYSGQDWQISLARAIETRLRHPLTWDGVRTNDAWNSIVHLMEEDEDYALNVVGLTLELHRPDSDRARSLARAFTDGGSAWMVAWMQDQRAFRLVRRMPAEVVQAVSDVLAGSSRSATYLGLGYRSGFGLNPDPSAAYRDAVRAVEAALRPIVSPNDQVATLGRMIGEIRSRPEDFRVRLVPSTGLDSVTAFREMLQLIWTSQLDRHGTDDETVPMNVALEQAQDAVMLAVTLVQWLHSGAFARVRSTD